MPQRRRVSRRLGLSGGLTLVLLAAAAGACREPDAFSIPEPGAALTVNDRAMWRSALAWPDECEGAFEASRASNDAGLAFYRLPGDLTLVQIFCAQGAYQPTQVFVAIDDREGNRRTSLLRFDRPESIDGVTIQTQRHVELSGDVHVSPASSEMTVVAFSRQTRDCGIWSRYRLRAAGPELAGIRARLPCPDMPADPVDPDPSDPPPEWETVR